MMVYKFGGASIANADRIRNVADIISQCKDKELIVVVSALGKMTNAFEGLLDSFVENNNEVVKERFLAIVELHNNIVYELGIENPLLSLVGELEELIFDETVNRDDYDYWYDKIVCYGELFSTTILYRYLRYLGVNSRWVDAREIIITDDNHRDANVDIEKSKRAFSGADISGAVVVLQGFIGGTVDGETTTLGREGSDYSAAVIAQLSGCTELTIWKDVEGVLNADPRLYSDTSLVKQLNYKDAVELAYSGAQIIHPKTIRPLHNCGISLYVRSFINREEEGSVINNESSQIETPFIIVKSNQTLVSISPIDLSFVLEESLQEIFTIANQFRQKINLIQSSAVSISLSVDGSRYFDDFVRELQKSYVVKYNEGLELVTIRGEFEKQITKDIAAREKSVGKQFLVQRTRRLIRILRKKC